MDHERARDLLRDERARVESLFAASVLNRSGERVSENEAIDPSDAAEPLTAQGIDDALHSMLVQRLHALDRADQRLEAGTYGQSMYSGAIIPDERLEADPVAEGTVDETTRSWTNG